MSHLPTCPVCAVPVEGCRIYSSRPTLLEVEVRCHGQARSSQVDVGPGPQSPAALADAVSILLEDAAQGLAPSARPLPPPWDEDGFYAPPHLHLLK